MALSSLTSTARYAVAIDPDFKACVEMNLLKIAQSVYSEAGATPGHATRAALATQVLNGPGGYTERFSFIVATDPNNVGYTKTTITDQNMQDAISATWNAVAGV